MIYIEEGQVLVLIWGVDSASAGGNRVHVYTFSQPIADESRSEAVQFK
jgi:hypothetical protein